MPDPLIREDIPITVNAHEIARLSIFESGQKTRSSLRRISECEANEYCEEEVQIVEGCTYEYEISNKDCRLRQTSDGTVTRSCISDIDKDVGTIRPKLNTGRFLLDVENQEGELLTSIALEVISSKLEYRSDYQTMLNDIVEACGRQLVYYLQAAAQTRVEIDPGQDTPTTQEQLSFLRAIVICEEFEEAMGSIIAVPNETLLIEKREVNTSRANRIRGGDLKKLIFGKPRIPVPESHILHAVLPTIPRTIHVSSSTPTIDTPENRFVKYTLKSFSYFVSQAIQQLSEINRDGYSRTIAEAKQINAKLTEYLDSKMFNEISDVSILPLGSPVLQRKTGYREVFRAWLNFQFASRLKWQGSSDLFSIGKRDVATLYEYWVFFQLLSIIENLFGIKAGNEVVRQDSAGLVLRLQAGKSLEMPLGSYGPEGQLSVRFSYNRMFMFNPSPNTRSSWSRIFRPDYSISFWPANIGEEKAQAERKIAHMHFDAKYRADSESELFGTDSATEEALDVEKEEEKKGTYKRADLLKMHAYRDGIRQSIGAYVIYPGEPKTRTLFIKYYDELPSIGAYALKPGPEGRDTGLMTLTAFIKKTADTLLDCDSECWDY